jgi:hypothetical protein
MKITFLTTALVAILGLALSGIPSNAQTDTNTTTTPAAPTTPAAAPSKPAKTAKKSAKTSYAGKITALSATSVSVTGKKELTLAITATTKFRIDKKKAAATSFAVGDSITGSYTTDSTGALTAASIDKKSTATK